MANITKRGDTYRIKVSCGYDIHGKQVVKSTTYKPDPTKSDKWNEKELQRQAVLFEESCKWGQAVTSAKFETFAREWFKDYAELKLKRNTLISYRNMQKRVYANLGHVRIDKISPLDIQRLVRSLVADGLGTDTVKQHVRLVSVILNYAVKKRVLTYNPCITVDYPMAQEKTRDFYTVEEVKQLLALLESDEEQNKSYALFFMLAVYTGCRRGELLGLEWKDIDFDDDTITIARAYYYDPYAKECFTDTPKTKSSRRGLKLPSHVMEKLRAFKTWQDEQREVCGGSWIETDRLFTNWDGSPMKPNTISVYLARFLKRTGMRKVTIHSFRHFNASILINSGVEVVTVQTALGHSTAMTTLSIYSHAFSNAQTKAMEAISNVIDL